MTCTPEQMKQLINSIKRSKHTPIALLDSDNEKYVRSIEVPCKKCGKKTYFKSLVYPLCEVECECPKCKTVREVIMLNINSN